MTMVVFRWREGGSQWAGKRVSSRSVRTNWTLTDSNGQFEDYCLSSPSGRSRLVNGRETWWTACCKIVISICWCEPSFLWCLECRVGRLRRVRLAPKSFFMIDRAFNRQSLAVCDDWCCFWSVRCLLFLGRFVGLKRHRSKWRKRTKRLWVMDGGAGRLNDISSSREYWRNIERKQ